jgi:hypothetical protein
MDGTISPVYLQEDTGSFTKSPTNEGKPKSKIFYWSYLINGLLISLPWGMIMNSVKFFEVHLKGKSYGEAFLTHFATSFLATKLLVLVAAMSAQKKLVKSTTLWFFGAVGILITMMAFLTLVLFADNFPTLGFYILTIGLSMLASINSGLLEAGVYHLAGQEHMINAVLIGQSISGLFSSVISFLFIAIFSGIGETTFAMGNFIVAILLSFGAIGLYYRSHFEFSKLFSRPIEADSSVEEGKVRSLGIWKKCSREFLSIFLLNFSSILGGMFLISKTISTFHSDSNATIVQTQLFRPTAFLVLSFSDLSARLMILMEKFRFMNLPVLPFSLGRILFIPLFLFGNLGKSDGTPIKKIPHFLASDVLFYCSIIVFAYSGGYLLAISSLNSQKKVAVHEKGKCSSLIAAFSLSGSLAGAIASTVAATILFS